jgi:hypothetical protein
MVLGSVGVGRVRGVERVCREATGATRRAWRPLLAVWLLALLVAAPLAALPQEAAAGQRAKITGGGNPLYSQPDPNSSVLLYVEYGHWVDVLSGPHDGMYEIRYYGTDGYIWSDKIELEGRGGGGGGGGGGVGGGSASGSEHWIIVDRSDASVNLIIGKRTIATYWASLGYDDSAYGFYATAIGTFYVTEMNAALTWNRYSNRYITHWIEFDPERDNGFHSFLKYENGEVTPNGAAQTGGCVAMGDGPISHVYDFAYVGMRVVVRW